jgi:hypothetical protein
LIDLMHEFQEVVGLHVVLGHQPAHGGAVALVIVLLHAERVMLGDAEELRHEAADAIVDLLPEIEIVRIERVVEVEHPGFDGVEAASNTVGGRHAHARSHATFGGALQEPGMRF